MKVRSISLISVALAMALGCDGVQAMDLLFARQAETGATLFIITHDPALAARCGRVTLLHGGRVLTEGEPGALTATDFVF